MQKDICTKCWAYPCVCGEQFKQSTTDHILLLMDGLTTILEERGIPISGHVTVEGKTIKEYMLSTNRGLSYKDHSTLLTVLQEKNFRIPDYYVKYLETKKLASEAWGELGEDYSKFVPYKAAFGVIMYMASLTYTATSLQYFFYQLLERSTAILKAGDAQKLIDFNDPNDKFMSGLYTAVLQIQMIIKDKILTPTPDMLMDWAILDRVNQFYSGDINTKFQAMVEITDIYANKLQITLDNVFMRKRDMTAVVDATTYKDYQTSELDDEELLYFLQNREKTRYPYYGMLPAH